MTTTLVLPGLIQFIQGLNGFKWFELNNSYENPCKKKKVCINYFDKQEKH